MYILPIHKKIMNCRQLILRMSACHHCMNCYEATAQHTLEEYSTRGQQRCAVVVAAIFCAGEL